MWKRKRKLEAEAVEAVKFCGCGSTLKKEVGSGSELGSIWLFESWKRKHFS